MNNIKDLQNNAKKNQPQLAVEITRFTYYLKFCEMNSSFQVRYYIKIIDPEIGQLPKTFKQIVE